MAPTPASTGNGNLLIDTVPTALVITRSYSSVCTVSSILDVCLRFSLFNFLNSTDFIGETEDEYE